MHGGCHTQTKKHTKESRQIHKVCLVVVVVVVVVGGGGGGVLGDLR